MLMLLSMNDELSSISPQTVEQIEVIPEVVLSEVSKLVGSVMSKRQGDQVHKIENGFTINKHQEIYLIYYISYLKMYGM